MIIMNFKMMMKKKIYGAMMTMISQINRRKKKKMKINLKV